MRKNPDTDRLTELEDDNRRLRRLLDARNAAGELRHRARNTLAILRTIIRSSALSGRDLPDFIAHLEDRLDSVARVQASAERRGHLDLHSLLADEMQSYTVSEGDGLSLDGPVVRFEPRAGQVFGLAIHELAVNAVEHGTAVPGGRIEVSWAVSPGEAGPTFALSWTEYAPAPAGQPGPDGFGTEVLTRMLAYELDASTTLSTGPDALRWEIRFPLRADLAAVLPFGDQPNSALTTASGSTGFS